MLKQVLINREELDLRVAVMEDGTLAELFIENAAAQSIIGNIYKGRVESIVPGLRAVFVNIGMEKNAFLHFNDVLPEYELPQRGRPEREYRRSQPAPVKEAVETEDETEDDYVEPIVSDTDDDDEDDGDEGDEGEKAPPPPKAKKPERKKRRLRAGDEILVQVVKEKISEKGARITTYLTLPGRFLVFMPFADNSGGVSRRIEDVGERRRLRQILREINEEVGAVIIRTAGLEQEEDEIRRDARQLAQSWDEIQKRAAKAHAPACVHNDHEILRRLVRDNFTADIDEILIDSVPAMRELIESCEAMVPALVDRIHYYDSATNIFDTFEVEKQFQKALKRKVWLRSGGAIIIDETEAMTAIDINSGKFVGDEDQESVILKTNLEAARAIARQLRLRDLGGLVVIDFIDMNSRDHELQVLREFKRALRSDRAKFSISDFSTFGLVEMTRKRVRKSLIHSLYRSCPYCGGSARILNEPQLWKQLKYDLIAELEQTADVVRVEIMVHSQFKTYLQENVLDALAGIAGRYGVGLNIIGCPEMHHEAIKFIKHLKSGAQEMVEVKLEVQGGLDNGLKKRLETTQMAHNNAS
ncbi:MAG: Rne/Rng family ribonuclease [Candidatus Sumerlaeia bacterium]